MNIRNVAVIAHVDHGKTTLIDALLKQTHVFRDNQEEMLQERILDSNDLERERGITILAKNCAIAYQDHKINIIDTPGHADFSGEVERTLNMADGALLIVDAQEGPMPQTRFVLKKALELDLKIIVVINKIDRQFSRVIDVTNRLADLFLELATNPDQLEYPTLYAVGKNGTVFNDLPTDPHSPGDIFPLLDAIIRYVPAPESDLQKPFKMVISALDYDPHLGRILIGKIHQGTIKPGQKVVTSNKPSHYLTVESLMTSSGLNRLKAVSAQAGDIIALTGFSDISIGDTLNDPLDTTALSAPTISEPTMHLTLSSNTSPFSGKEGQFTTSRQIGDRLTKELESNLSLRVETLGNGKFKVSGRGELHLAVLLETMRREGFEMEVGKPEVIIKKIDGVDQEPVEEVSILVPQEYVGVINQEMGKRYASLIKMEPLTTGESEFLYQVPTRAIIGLRSLLLTLTKGTVIFNSQVIGYKPIGVSLPKLRRGALISAESGKAVEYGLRNLKGRGISFVHPGTPVYEGMIVGLNAKDEDIEINVCKEKNLTNHRASFKQGITQLAPDMEPSLEESLDLVENDELLEITPQSLRLRKKFLTELERRRNRSS